MTTQTQLLEPWIIWVDEAGEYACRSCAIEHAEKSNWVQVHDDFWSADPDGEDHANETRPVWPYSDSDIPQGCIGCGEWLNVNIYDEGREYMIEHDFPAEVFTLYGLTKPCAHTSPADYGASQVKDGVLIHPCDKCGLIMAWTVSEE